MTESNHEFPDDNEAEDSPQSGSKGFCSFLYNSETGAFLGRTGSSWLKIGIFYIIYYFFLAGFFVGMLSVFMFGILQEEIPYRTGLNSLLNMNPGLGFRPHISTGDTLIEFTAGKRDTYVKYSANLQQMYDMYQEINVKSNSVNVRTMCGKDDKPDGKPEKVCKFKWDDVLEQCKPGNDFGFSTGTPCVVLKLNRIYGWMPDPISSNVSHPLVRCFGENPADTENIGNINYYPNITTIVPAVSPANQSYGYFNKAFYPYIKQAGYRAPLVALQFADLQKNTLVMIQCRLLNLKNSKFDKTDREAMVRFEMMIKT